MELRNRKDYKVTVSIGDKTPMMEAIDAAIMMESNLNRLEDVLGAGFYGNADAIWFDITVSDEDAMLKLSTVDEVLMVEEL